jgi:hypothetical protein
LPYTLPLLLCTLAPAGEEHSFEVRIEDWDGAAGYGRRYVVSPEKISITRLNDFGDAPKEVWSAALNLDEQKLIARCVDDIKIDKLEDKYVEAHICDGLFMRFRFEKGGTEPRNIVVSNIIQMDLVKFCREINRVLPANQQLYYGLQPVPLERLAAKKVTKWAGQIYLGGYKPKKVQALDHLPLKIKEKVDGHLAARLGNELYSKLRFVDGEIVEKSKVPNAEQFQWKLHAYSLQFELAYPEEGVAAYHAQLRLDEEGDVVEEINLPNAKGAVEKCSIIPLKQALVIARDVGVPLDELPVDIEIGYDKRADSLCWIVKTPMPLSRDHKQARSAVRIDAHLGKVLEK